MTISIPGLNQLSDDHVFAFCSNIVIIPWLVLALAPRWKMRRPMIYGVVLLQSIVYTLSFAAPLISSEDSVVGTFAEMGTLSGVKKLFRDDDVILPAWVHYLAFDILVGNYLVEQNMGEPTPIPQILMFLILFFNLMCGPVGIVLYAVIKTIMVTLVSEARDKPGGKAS